MLRVALTGGIGCGKSAASSHFESLGVPVIDADRISRQLTADGQPALTSIRMTFGDEVFDDNSLDRAALKQLVFSRPEARQQLEAILHPLIRAEMARQLDALNSSYVIIVIPLLVETGQTGIADRILVIDCSREQQLQRTRSRDSLTDEEINRIIDNQAGRAQRLAYADDIVENTGSMDDFLYRLDQLHNKYLDLAKQD